jgi:membrane-bound lytic murein transglycosylase D
MHMVRAISLGGWILLLSVASPLAAQDSAPVDSLLTTWPIAQRLQEQRSKPRTPAADATAIVHTGLRKLAPAFPVFADSLVERYIHLYSGERRDHFRAVLGKAAEFGPMIERELARHGLPHELKHLPLALSAMNPQAHTTDGRAGLWLLSWPAALRQGLVVNAHVDERRDPERGTRAAMRELQELHGHYGDWPSTVMAFACGPANLERARRRSSDRLDPRLLYRAMDPGARDILPRLMAFTWLAAQAERLGLEPLTFRSVEPSDTVRHDSTLTIAVLNRVIGTRPERFRALNPTLAGRHIPAGTPFLLPRSEAQRFGEMAFVVLEAQRSGKRPAAPAPVPETVDRLPDGREAILYRIVEGDHLEGIAARFGAATAEVMAWNELAGPVIDVGNTLVIYVAADERLRYEADTTGIARPSTVPPGALRSQTAPPPATPKGFTWYTVRSGDSLYLIAKRHPGVSPDDLMRLNGISANIRPGQRLKIPTP